MRAHTRTGLRIGAYVASGALALSGAVLAVTPAQAAFDPAPANQAADWLAGELDGGLMHNPNFGGFDDYGLTSDTALALDAVGGHGVDVTAIQNALDDHIDDYIQPFGGNHLYAGGLAKLGVVADLGASSAATFGGRNLVTELEARVLTNAPVSGRIEDDGFVPGDQFDDDAANVLGQSYAAQVLSAAGSAKAASVTDFLLKQQCANGGFRLYFTADKAATDQTCADNTQAQTDATAIAVQQLDKIPTSGAITAAKTAARAYLVSTQKDDGSWGGGTGTEAPNANSTGLAAIALGDGAPAQEAAAWLRTRQATYYDLCDKLASQRGAMALDVTALNAGRTNGITSGTEDQWRRATAQALPALAFLQADTTPAAPVLTGPTAYVKAGSKPVLRIAGVNAGDRLCLTGTGTAARFTASAASVTRAVTLPQGTATRTYFVRDADGHHDSASLTVLGAKTLTVTRTPGTVKRGAQVTVAARGLADGEAAKIYYGSTLVKSGAASASGNLVARFSAGSSVGTKSIRAYGQFTDIRRGATSVKVVK